MADDTHSDGPGQDADPTTTEDQADDAEATVAVAAEDEHRDTAAAAVFVEDDEDGADAADDTVVVAAVEYDTNDADADAADATDNADADPNQTGAEDTDADHTADDAPDADNADADGTPDARTADGDAPATEDGDADVTDVADTEADATDDADAAATGDADATAVLRDDDAASTQELTAELAQLRSKYEVLERQVATTHHPKRSLRPSKYFVSMLCVVLGAILLPFAVIARWTASTVLDTDAYVETVTPLAQNEDVQEALSFRVSETLLEVIDFEDLAKDALPDRAGFLAAPIQSGAQRVIEDVVEEFVSTQAFEDLWVAANRIGHEDVVAVLTGSGNDQLQTAGGKVVVKLGPLAKEVLNGLDDILGTDLSNSIPAEQVDGEFVLVQSDDLAHLQDEVNWFDRFSWLLPIFAIALLVASVALSEPRRLGLRRLGIAIVAATTVSLLLYSWIRGQYVGGLPDDIHNPDAAAAFFDITTRFLPRDMRVLFAVGVVILFLVWLFGPTGWAGRTRAWWNTLVGQAAHKSANREVGDVPKWVATNERPLLVTSTALGVLTLVVWSRPTGQVVLLVVSAVGVAMAAVHILGEIGRRAETISEDTSAQDTATTQVDSAHADSTPNAATDKADSTDNADPQAVPVEIGY